MDALILTCGTGGGHNSAAKAVKQEMEHRGHHVHLMNPYMLRSMALTRAIDGLYIFIAKRMPRFFGVIYNIGEAYRRLPGHSPVYGANHRAARCLNDYLKENHFDAVIMTHLYPAEMITYLKSLGEELPFTLFIATDYACIPFTEETDCDAYVIPMESLKKDFLRFHIPEEKLKPLGIPVSKQFSQKESRKEAIEKLGLEEDKHYILISGGSMGAGHIEQIVEYLLERYENEEKVRLIVLCGSFQKLYDKLKAHPSQKVIPLNFTDQMPDYLKACDLYLTKPGGLSSTEAAVAGVPLIHISPIPGCESKNLKCFKNRGMAIPAVKTKEELFRALDALDSEQARETMIRNQHKWIPEDAAGAICRFVEAKTGKKKL